MSGAIRVSIDLCFLLFLFFVRRLKVEKFCFFLVFFFFPVPPFFSLRLTRREAFPERLVSHGDRSFSSFTQSNVDLIIPFFFPLLVDRRSHPRSSLGVVFPLRRGVGRRVRFFSLSTLLPAWKKKSPMSPTLLPPPLVEEIERVKRTFPLLQQ